MRGGLCRLGPFNDVQERAIREWRRRACNQAMLFFQAGSLESRQRRLAFRARISWQISGIAAAVYIHSVVVGESEFRGDCVHLTGWGRSGKRERCQSGVPRRWGFLSVRRCDALLSGRGSTIEAPLPVISVSVLVCFCTTTTTVV